MNTIELELALLAVVPALVWAAQRVGVPYPILLVLGGLGIGYLPGVPSLQVDPEIIFLVFLPPLVHAAGYRSSPRELKANAGPIALLSVGLVIATTAGVAAAAHALVPGLSWPVALVLGAIVSPTDTVAAASIFRRLGVPERVVSILEGESLINDGTGLVLYRVALAAVVAGSLSAAGSLRDLFLVGIGGAAFGLVVAFVVRQVRRHLDDPLVEIAVTLLTPYLAYVPAEQLGLSGILAGVASGVYLGWWHSEITSPGTRLQADAFWEVFIFLLESILFVLIGLQVPTVLDALGDRSSLELARWAVLVSLAVIGIRVVWVFVVTYLPPLLSPRLRVVKNPDWRNVAVISWAGMRGAVSLAAALAIPLTIESGAPFPNRDLVLFLTLAVIGATLVVQGLTLPVLIKLLGVEEVETDERKAAVARFRTTEAALGRIAELSFEDDEARQNALDRAREMYTARARQLTGICRTGIPDTEDSELAWLQLRGELLDVERAALRDLQREGRVNIGVLRQVERDLDLEEGRLTRLAAPPPEAPAPV